MALALTLQLKLLASSFALGVVGAPNAAAPPSPNMNGAYALSNTPKQVPGKFPTNYADYPGTAEYFDVYSPPITSTYAEIFWKTLDTVPLPPAIVKRFAGKPMAVVGLEWDQVRRTAAGDVSVPMNVAYNHHYSTNLLGADSKLIQVDAGDPRVSSSSRSGHGPALDRDGKALLVQDLNPNSTIPNSQIFLSQNGGEARLSFKGCAPGYARPIMSPTKFSITVMQIDTWNRDAMNKTGPTPFVQGPMPRNSYAKPHDPYSGLLECPMTSRVTKELDAEYFVQLRDSCSDDIASEAECAAVVAGQLSLPGFSTNTSTVNDASLPDGCSFAVHMAAHKLVASFNTHTTGSPRPDPSSDSDSDSPLCGHGVSALIGVEKSLVELKLSLDQARPNATLELTGPDGLWFGVGFNAHTMGDEPWTVIVDGAGGVTERKLANHQAGLLLPRSVYVLSNTVTSGNRTVILTRSLQGTHFNFSFSETTVPFIAAVGSGPQFDYHKSSADAKLTMLATNAPNCVCAKDPPAFGKGGGHFVYEDGSKVAFKNECQGQVLEQRNPTCDLRTYTGGIQTCLDTWRLLDKDQAVPWQDQPLVYQHKFRFWFQDYTGQHEPKHYSWHLGAVVGEYDVPQCAAGTAPADCIHRLEGTQLIPDEHAYLVALKSHCHSGTCISIQIYFNDTGELLCDQRSVFGQNNPNARFAEPGYINRPPCLWGDAKFGLEPPPKVGGRVLRAVAITNATNAHHGEMGIPVLYTVSEP